MAPPLNFPPFGNMYAPPWFGFSPVLKGIRDMEYDLDLPPVNVPAGGFSRGYSVVDGGGLTGPSTYEASLGPLSSPCGGADLGYVSVPASEVLGFTTWMFPILRIIAPY